MSTGPAKQALCNETLEQVPAAERQWKSLLNNDLAAIFWSGVSSPLKEC
jgi:hypothetical protein